MITQLRGKMIEKAPTYIVVDCNGVGYLLHISLNTFGALPKDELITIYTHLSIKEDAHTLYGFITRLEREIFRLLISVSGVGPSIARTMLSSMSSELLIWTKMSCLYTIRTKKKRYLLWRCLDLQEKFLKKY